MKRALLATTLLALPLAARAQPVTGLYVGAGAGANWLQDTRTRVNLGPLPGPTFHNGYDVGPAVVGSIGWGFGNGVRVEAEGSWRRNEVSSGFLARDEKKYGATANVLFDLDIGSPWVFPYLGAGAGAQWVQLGNSSQDSKADLAYQAILGASFPIPWVVGLSATAEYRYLGVAGKRSVPTSPGTARVSDDNNHSVLLGLRYAFNVVPPAAVAPSAPPVAAAPAPAPARSYLVFFDWDSADLTSRARAIIAEAAQASTRVQTTRIDVAGHADRTGTPQYNNVLSRRRAEVVAGELVTRGVARESISIQAYGDTRPLVPTAEGVREPQNRRVEIVLH